MTVSGEHRSLHREEPGANSSPEFGVEFAVAVPYARWGGGGWSVRESLLPLSFWHLRFPFVSVR